MPDISHIFLTVKMEKLEMRDYVNMHLTTLDQMHNYIEELHNEEVSDKEISLKIIADSLVEMNYLMASLINIIQKEENNV